MTIPLLCFDHLSVLVSMVKSLKYVNSPKIIIFRTCIRFQSQSVKAFNFSLIDTSVGKRTSGADTVVLVSIGWNPGRKTNSKTSSFVDSDFLITRTIHHDTAKLIWIVDVVFITRRGIYCFVDFVEYLNSAACINQNEHMMMSKYKANTALKRTHP